MPPKRKCSYKGASTFTQRSKKYKSAYSSAGNGRPNFRAWSTKSGNNNIFSVSRSVTLVSNTAYTNTPLFGALSFNLSQLPNASDFTSLYDEFKLLGVKCQFIPTTNVSGFTATTDFTLPALYTWIDTDDATTPTALTQGQQFETFKCHGIMGAMKTRSLVPEAQKALYQGAFTGFGGSPNTWVDTNSPGVQHYGLKWGLVNGTAGGGAYDVVCTYYLQFRKTL